MALPYFKIYFKLQEIMEREVKKRKYLEKLERWCRILNTYYNRMYNKKKSIEKRKEEEEKIKGEERKLNELKNKFSEKYGD